VNAPDYLRAGIAAMESRGTERDAPGGERSMARAVTAFNAIYGARMTEEQGWMFMAVLKAARSAYGTRVRDDYIDGAAYFSLAGEAADRKDAP